ncbi:MAG TPA: DUF1579 domain-containing protein [Planctomycetota bacterium]|nr:DUF1579 domain-containing protein [Planctomycetota bacterium]
MKICFAVAVLAALTTPLFAQEAPKPAPEHQKLTASVGTWDAVVEMMGEDGKPQTNKAVSEITAIGGLWVIDDFKGSMGGADFHGHGTTGYDPAKGKYIGTWIDSWSTSIMTLEGTYDAAKKALTMSGTGPGMDGKPVLHHMVTTEKDANTRVFEMFVPGPDGKAMKIMTITYTRRAQKGAAK